MAASCLTLAPRQASLGSAAAERMVSLAELPLLPLAAGLLALAILADLGLLILLLGLIRVFARAPRLRPQAGSVARTSLTVVVPAYNEEENIEACLESLLASAAPCPDWRLLVVDDRSTDATAARAGRVLARVSDSTAGCLSETLAPAGVPIPGSAQPAMQPPPRPASEPGSSGSPGLNADKCGVDADGAVARCRLLDAGPRPSGERWVGKNWACSRAMEEVRSDWVLFIDADVRLAPDTLRRALNQASDEGADLLSLAPRLSCGCLAEWMVQPIMASLLGLGFPIEAANDPADPTAFAAGPFMLFRRSAYEAIGGHRALAGEVVEDLALARRIKGAGLRLRYLLGLDAAELRMYRDFAALWEGWSKNWFAGLDRSVPKALGASSVVLLLFSGPWLVAAAAALALVGLPIAGGTVLGIPPGASGTLITAAPGTGSVLSGLPADGAGLWLQALLASLGQGEFPMGGDQDLLAPCLAMALAAGLLGIALQLALRLWTRRRFQVPLTLWWLMGAGGLVVAALGPTSVWRSLTGRGWTWKGRSLAG